MSSIARFGVSLDKGLLEKFDKLIESRSYTNRSEAFRDLIRQELVKKEWQDANEVTGAVTLIYDHHRRELVNKLLDIQHDFSLCIISAQHIHIDHNNCLEILAVKGSPEKVQRLSDNLKAVKGVKHSTLSMSTTGKDMI
ncbi:MAG TPA: nickel-responsive transcriptional regulator NikR [Candidatus Margulisiibacteriota bacterium]|nr:nickel-responsive transcriptional regulator NikR [Candidatus Margulisiibacteriota bacterium]